LKVAEHAFALQSWTPRSSSVRSEIHWSPPRQLLIASEFTTRLASLCA
jgi:hypothetical protein